MNNKHVLMMAAFAALSATFTACSDNDDDVSTGGTTVDPSEVSFIVTSNDLSKSLRGGSRMKVFTDLNTPKTDQLVYGDSSNTAVAYSVDGFTQAKYNSQAGFYTGYIYRQGSVDESKGGIGSGKMGARTFTYANGKLTVSGVNVITNFGNVGTFGNYSYAAMNSDLTVNIFSAAGAMTTWSAPDLTKYAVDGVAPVITDIMDLGNNRLAMALYYSNRDSAAVAFTDYSFSTISNVVFDSRIGKVYGAWRSVRYAMGGVADNGDAYLFCGTSDDNNHDVVDSAKSVYFKISSDTQSIASYFSLDGKEWQMVRIYKNQYPSKLYLGICSQAPQAEECTSTFEELSLTTDNVDDFRMGE